MEFKNVVIGAGFSGAVIARCIAEEKNEEVLIVEKRNHIAGNAFDHYNEQGILIHKYGPHIFHTNNKIAWDWLSRFTEWNLYQHRVYSYIDGMEIPMPISVETINKLYNYSLNCDEIKEWLCRQSYKVEELNNSEDFILSKVGKDIYEKFFRNYTYKQWGVYPDKLDPSVISRIPIRLNRDTRYFSDKYQGIPKYGYTEMFNNILNHRNIHILLNTEWSEVRDKLRYDRLFYSGPVDEFFKYKYGKLGYRSVRFEYKVFYNTEFYQKVGTVNYPNDYDFTRITEYKHLTGQKCNGTVIALEYPMVEGEPYYPIPREENNNIYNMYLSEAKTLNNVYFIGRLGSYRYLNMDQVVEQSLVIKNQI